MRVGRVGVDVTMMLRGSTASVEFKLYRHYRNVPDTDNHRRTDRLRSAKMTRLAA